MAIEILKGSAQRSDLVDSGTVARPLGATVCRTSVRALDGVASHQMGVWECTPGSYERQIVNAELMHVLGGRSTFTPVGGEPLRIEAGDTVFFPAHTEGRWDIHELMRKVYVVLPQD